MKRKIEIGFLATLAALAVVTFLLNDKSQYEKWKTSPQGGKEISLRNVTEDIIYYNIWPWDSKRGPEKKVLKVGEIHRYSSLATVDVIFESGERIITRHLLPGKPYCFRYDENNQIQVYEGSHGIKNVPDLAPYLSTPMVVVDRMLEIAKVDNQDVIYDLGSGDGRIIISAAKKYGARGVGIDIDPQRIKESRQKAKEAGVQTFVEFRLADATQADISEATVVTLYLLPESNEILRPRFEKQLKSGVYVVSHNYQIPGWEEREIDAVEMRDETGKVHTLFLYKR